MSLLVKRFQRECEFFMLFPPLLKGLRKMCVLEASDLPDASSMSLRIKDSEKARNNLVSMISYGTLGLLPWIAFPILVNIEINTKSEFPS